MRLQTNRTIAFAASWIITAAMILAGTSRLYAQDPHAGHKHPAEPDAHQGHDHEADASPAMGAEPDDAAHAGEAHSDEVTLTPEAIQLANITLARAEKRSANATITVPARVSFNTEAMAHVGTQVTGRLTEIAVKLGDEVAVGDLLLVLESPELGTAQSDLLQREAAIAAAEIGVEASRTMVEVARAGFQRAEKLRESNGISITEFLERQGALRQAEANVRLAEAEVKVAESTRTAAENQLHIFGVSQEQIGRLLESGEISTRYEVRAPISGRIVERHATPGEVVHSDDEELLVIANMDDLWVEADVPEQAIGRVALGNAATISVASDGGSGFAGSVTYIAPQLDPRTRTGTVRISTSEASSEIGHEGHDHGDGEGTEHQRRSVLKPGMFAQVELQLTGEAGNSVETIMVPHGAVLTVEGAPAVFVTVPGEPNTFAKRTVKIGERIGRYYPVFAGLAEGEEYVATNPFILKADLGKAGAAHEH